VGGATLNARALELGVNLFDTSAGYGESEAMLGRAMVGHPRDSYLVATKWTHRLDDGLVTDPDVIVRSLEQSLERLQTDYVDIFQIHGVIPDHYDQVADIYIPTMQRLQEQGKTRFLGVTEMLTQDSKHEGMSVAMSRHPDVWDSVMLKYGIMNQWASKKALPLASDSSTGVLNMAPVRLTLTRPEQLSERMNEWGEDDGGHALDWLSGGDSAELIRKGLPVRHRTLRCDHRYFRYRKHRPPRSQRGRLRGHPNRRRVRKAENRIRRFRFAGLGRFEISLGLT
jgi:aryl-alcohol dehydrogenase-like predicted oxidoreductase